MPAAVTPGRPIPAKSAEILALESVLLEHRDSPPDHTIAYAELSRQVRFDVRQFGRLHRAVLNVLRDYQVHFVCIRGEGIRRANSDMVLDSAASYIPRMHGAARQGRKTLTAAKPNEMNNEAKIRFNVLASHLGALEGVTTARSVKHIESAVRTTMTQLPVEKTLAAFLPSLRAEGNPTNGNVKQ